MAIYYLDKEFRLHLEQKEDFLSWEDKDGFFEQKSATFIEGYRVIPEGKTWKDKNGTIYYGLTISAAVDYSTLTKAQSEMDVLQSTIAELDTALLDITYENIIGGLE